MSDTRHQAQTAALAAIDGLRWRVLNFVQACWLMFWTAFLVPFALGALCLTWSTRVPLWMARNVWAPPLLWAGGVKVDVRGLENLQGVNSCMFMSNHQSMIDIAVVFYALPRNLRFVAKRILLFVPFLGWYMWGMGMVFVDRKHRHRAIKALKRAVALFESGGDAAHIMTFPEGTRTRDGRVLPFKKGLFMLAIESGVPIVPVAIEGAYNVLPADGFSVRPGTIKLAVGRPVETAGMTGEQRDELIKKVRDAVIDLNVSLGGKGGDKATFAS